MSNQKTGYQSTIDKLYDWLKDAAENDALSMLEVVEQAKRYLHAAEELSSDEIRTLENYLLRDFTTFTQQWQKDADQSIWFSSIKSTIWQLLASLSDQNKLEMYEMEMDIEHQGIYQAGELVSVGRIICNDCGHQHQVDFVEQIQPCLECGGTSFTRAFLGQ